MEFEIAFAEDGSKVVITTCGRATIEGFRGYLQARTRDPRWRPEMDVLLDLSRLDVSKVDPAFVYDLVLERERLGESVGTGRTAVVAQQPTFGLVSMFEGLADGRVPVSYRVCKTREEAEAWLSASAARA